MYPRLSLKLRDNLSIGSASVTLLFSLACVTSREYNMYLMNHDMHTDA